jgi:Zn-dependent protease
VTAPGLLARCACGGEIAPGLLACPGCGRLTHSEDLSRLAAAAESAEREGDLTAALTSWRRAIALLPAKTVQRATIEKRMGALSAAIDGRGAPPEPAGAATDAKGARGNKKKAGAAAGAGTIGLLLLKSKAVLVAVLANAKVLVLGLLKLPTLLSMLVFLRWSGGRGMGVGLGIVASIYVHEMGHVAALRRYGIDASAPMFVPGFGAFVRMGQYPTDAHEEARTGLAGPLWGLLAAGVAAAIALTTGSLVVRSVASFGATINLFNLIPVWQLDGARGLRALSRGERYGLAAIAGVAALGLHEWMPGIVAAFTVVRAFGKDAHPVGDRRMFALFAGLVLAHGLIATLPGAMGP